MADPVISITFDGCFGFFHPGRASRGVILCGPVGEEADYVYHTWREFAERLAGAGLSTLRFDYPGLYNSSDLDEGSDPPTAWVESIKSAIGWIKTEAGVEEVVLVGIRFGAALALKCAEELGGLARLVLMAPVVSGVAYQRELALFAKLSEGGAAMSGRGAPSQAATLFTAEKTFGVESLKCGQSGEKPADRILILWEAASGGGKSLGERLRALGSEVIDQPFNGYGELMIRPEWARYPEDAFGKVLEWLQDGVTAAMDSPTPIFSPRAQVNGELLLPGAREVTCYFREENPLFGIECLPDAPREGRPGIAFLNTGAVPTGGMNRMWVSMARRAAALGFTSLRFDICGVGDTPTPPVGGAHAHPRIEDACVDVAAAISRLQDLGCSTITVIGFCWGSQLAYHAALADERVTGLVMINARRQFWDLSTDEQSLQIFSTHLRLLRDPAKWRSFRRGDISFREVKGFIQHFILAAIKAVHGLFAESDTSVRKTIGKLRSFKDRGTETLLVQGNDDTFLSEFEDYFGVSRHAFPSLLHIHTYFFPEVSHRFPNEKSLFELMQIVGDHLSRGKSVDAPIPAAGGRARPG